MAMVVPRLFQNTQEPLSSFGPSRSLREGGELVHSTSVWAVALAHGKADYPVVNYSEPSFLFLVARHLAISQLISFALRAGKERGRATGGN